MITDRRILLEAKFDINAKTHIPEIMFIRWSSLGYLEIDRKEIVRTQNKFVTQRVLLTLKDGSVHQFSCFWSRKNICKAISNAQPVKVIPIDKP